MAIIHKRRPKIHRWRENEITKESFNLYHQKNWQKHLQRKGYFKYISSCWYFLCREQYWKDCYDYGVLSTLFGDGSKSYIARNTVKIYCWSRNCVILNLYHHRKTLQPNLRRNLSMLHWLVSNLLLTNQPPSTYCSISHDRTRL